MSNEEIIKELNDISDAFSKKHGEILCLRANLAAINRMLIKRNRGEELLESLKTIIDGYEKNENCIIDTKS